MYGGDEVSAIVLDLGSSCCKAGYAGEDTPKAVFPSSVGLVEADADGDVPMGEADGAGGGSKGGKRYNVNSLSYRRDGEEVVSPFKDGVLDDWDVVENIWDHALKRCLTIAPNEHPMLLAEPPFNTPQAREKCVQLMFEKHAPPALFLAKNPVLTSFASGRATSLVVDCGAGGTTVTAVHDGYALQKSISRSPVGGDLLTKLMLRSVESKGAKVRPRYTFDRKKLDDGEFAVKDLSFPKTKESYHEYKRLEIAADCKEAICRVSESPYNEEEYASVPSMAYELPDGNTLEVGAARFKVPEVLFNPALLSTFEGQEELKGFGGEPLASITDMCIESINKVDVDVRKELYGGMLLTGGSSLFPQMRERLDAELGEKAPHTARVKVTAPNSAVERRFSSWIGGSILASLGSFQQMWLSKSEYEEHGASYVHRKCA